MPNDTPKTTPVAALENALREKFPGLQSPAGMADAVLCELEKQGFTVEHVRWTSFLIEVQS